MNKKIISISFMLVFTLIFVSGCTEVLVDNTIKYSEHPTQISYIIDYGYLLNCSGEGSFKLNYDCDTPEVLLGTASITEVFNIEYTEKTVATFNQMYSWNLSKTSCSDLKLGLSASVTSQSFMVDDLNGKDALTIQEIQNNHSDLVEQYCNAQSNETITFIDPNNQDIKTQAQEILNQAGSINAFLVAKQAFIWLKENTDYETHNENNNVQTCLYTLEHKTGDCDDLSFLYISLCRASDIPARFIRGFLIKETYAIPHAWAEVYVGEKVGDDGWIPVECAGDANDANYIESEINQNFALESAGHLRLFKDDGSDESMIMSLSGISYLADSNLEIESLISFSPVKDYAILKSNELHINENGKRSYH